MKRLIASHINLGTLAIKPIAGVLALIALASLVGGSLLSLALEASRFETGFYLDAYLLRVARFTIFQAILSALLSVLFAIPVARALYAQADFSAAASFCAFLRFLWLCLHW